MNGSKYTLRPTFESIMEFNDRTGVDIFKAIDEGLTTKLTVAAIWSGIRGEEIFSKEGNTSFETIGRECQGHGFANCVSIAVQYITRAVASDEQAKKQKEENQTPQE